MSSRFDRAPTGAAGQQPGRPILAKHGGHRGRWNGGRSWAVLDRVAALAAAILIGSTSLTALVPAPALAGSAQPAPALASNPGVPAENLVQNGSFESPTVTRTGVFDTIFAGDPKLTGWTISRGSIDLIQEPYWPAFEGQQSIDLDGSPGASTISQAIPTTPGQQYILTFSYSMNWDGSGAGVDTASMRVSAGVPADDFTAIKPDKSSNDMNYQAGSLSFTGAAESTSTTIEFASTDAGGSSQGIALDDVSVVAVAAEPDFSFGDPDPGTLLVQQGQSSDSAVPVNLTEEGSSFDATIASVTSTDEGATGVSADATYDGESSTATVSVTAAADATPGDYEVVLRGQVGEITHDVTISVTVPAPAEVGLPLLTNAYNAPGTDTTIYAGRISADPNTSYTITFASASSCPDGVFPAEGSTDFGAISVTTDDNGNTFFNPSTPANETPNSIDGVPGDGRRFIAARVTGPAGRYSGFSPCVVNSPDNDTWPRALRVSGDGTPVSSGTWIDQPGTARWFKVHVVPGGSVTLDLSNVPEDYDVYLFRDIKQTYDALAAEQDLTKLSAEFAGSGFSGSGFSGSGFSGSGFSGSGFSGSGFSGSGFSGSGFSPDSYSGSGFSGSGFSGSGFSGSGFSGSGFSGSGFSGSGFSGSGFSGSGFSPDSFSAAQVYSLIAWSNNLGLATEHAASNTWTSTGDFYIRVNGKNGVSSLAQPFTLSVTADSNLCTPVANAFDPDKGAYNPALSVKPGPITNTYDTIILTDTSRFGGLATSGMVAKLGDLASATNGHVVDLNAPGRVRDLQALADANTGCVWAKNLVAQAGKDIVDAYRKGNTSGGIKYVVLAGGDNVLPFFRYPDTSSIGPEVNYFPPVDGNSASEASLRSNYTLGQDTYGASASIPLGVIDFPIPDLPVGRLVETPTEIAGMVQAYLDQSVVTPSTSLVTGYDFIEDAALVIKGNLDAGTGQAGASLIDPYGAAPATGWNATALKSAFLGQRNDITFLGGHFSANSALAADFQTIMTTDDVLAASPSDLLKNTIVFSIGCHSGYNIVDGDGIPNVTRTLDWPQVFAKRQVTSILGTGYQYGDTDFIEYSERIYTEFSNQLRYAVGPNGSSPVGIGNALVASKLAYLKQTPAIGDLHQKALLESALYGLPMLGVDMPNRINPPAGSGAVALTSFGTEPGLTTGLRYADLDQSTPSVPQSKTLNVLGGGTLTATYYTAPDGRVHTASGAPVLPLYATSAKAADAGYVLRGIGFIGGSYTDSTITPLTGAPGTELQSAHTSFNSPTFYPTEMWSANYVDAVAGGGGVTLFTTPAQHRAPTPGSDTVTLRLYGDLKLRLFYSNSVADGSKSAPPAIYGITTDLQGGDTRISAHVVGDPRADVQQVWVTYTEPGSWLWKSFPLGRDGTDPSLWSGLNALAPGTQFMVQAVNGFGVVSRNDNSAAYYRAGVAASTPASSAIALSGAASGTYGTTASITATLTSSGNPISGKLVVVHLGSVTRSGVTDQNGQVKDLAIPLSAGAGTYPLSATFLGDDGLLPASASNLFTIAPAGSTVTVTCPATITYTGSPLTPCTARVTGAGGLDEPLSVTYTANTAVGTATASAVFYGDAAHSPNDGTSPFSIRWLFTGFFAPVDSQVLNRVTAGQAIPVKFSLGGDWGLSILTAGYPKSVTISCDSGAQEEIVDETVVVSSSGLVYSAGSGRYQYNWKTPKSYAGSCRQLQVGLRDGSVWTANFRFK